MPEENPIIARLDLAEVCMHTVLIQLYENWYQLSHNYAQRWVTHKGRHISLQRGFSIADMQTAQDPRIEGTYREARQMLMSNA